MTGVEAVRGLLLNELPFRLPFLLLLLSPPTVFRVLSRLGGRSPLLREIGEIPFRFRSRAREPKPLIRRWPAESPILWALVWGQLLKLALYLAWVSTTWLLVRYFFPQSTATIYLILILGYLTVYAANLLDFADFISPLRVRLVGLVLSSAGGIALWVGLGREAFIAAFGAIAAASLWALLRERRARWALVALFFAVLTSVLAMGGDTRRMEAWAEDDVTPAWQRVERWPMGGDEGPPVVVMAASGGGSRAALMTGMMLTELNRREDLREVAENLQVISSVSGGSLASAAYTARLHRLFRSQEQAGSDPDRSQAVEDLNKSLADDFIYPTLKGALLPGITRGRSIEAHWEEQAISLGSLRLSDLAESWRDAAEGDRAPFPIPLFNSVTLDGNAVVISPLAKRLYVDPDIHEHAQGPSNYYHPSRHGGNIATNPVTWVYYRDAVYGLEDLLQRFDPKISQAVRASANFPFGFPVVSVRTNRLLFFSPEPEQKTVDLTDGGALSNSGLWSLSRLLIEQKSRLQACCRS